MYQNGNDPTYQAIKERSSHCAVLRLITDRWRSDSETRISKPPRERACAETRSPGIRERKKTPAEAGVSKKCGNHLLSPCDYHRPCGLNCRVRNGNGWFLRTHCHREADDSVGPPRVKPEPERRGRNYFPVSRYSKAIVGGGRRSLPLDQPEPHRLNPPLGQFHARRQTEFGNERPR